ncbi:hypothetical protein B1H39_02325 [Serratia marcescens]|uniref:hypothetical protein n=1 Tax=Serratia marcescens TaxID=615 RepID=UPI0009D39C2D|nr:hypothetical protein [Serratia marcescens]OPJ97360.1 hypothetical protein B1H39_02325 [Serratia marcescens]
MSDTKRTEVPLLFPEEHIVRRGANGGGGDMLDMLEKRVERLESDVAQIKEELTVLTTRSEAFATKSDIEAIRTEHQTLRADVVKELAASEKRINDKFEGKFDSVNKRLDGINDRLLWTLMVPAILAILLWFVKEAILK